MISFWEFWPAEKKTNKFLPHLPSLKFDARYTKSNQHNKTQCKKIRPTQNKSKGNLTTPSHYSIYPIIWSKMYSSFIQLTLQFTVDYAIIYYNVLWIIWGNAKNGTIFLIILSHILSQIQAVTATMRIGTYTFKQTAPIQYLVNLKEICKDFENLVNFLVTFSYSYQFFKPNYDWKFWNNREIWTTALLFSNPLDPIHPVILLQRISPNYHISAVSSKNTVSAYIKHSRYFY